MSASQKWSKIDLRGCGVENSSTSSIFYCDVTSVQWIESGSVPNTLKCHEVVPWLMTFIVILAVQQMRMDFCFYIFFSVFYIFFGGQGETLIVSLWVRFILGGGVHFIECIYNGCQLCAETPSTKSIFCTLNAFLNALKCHSSFPTPLKNTSIFVLNMN